MKIMPIRITNLKLSLHGLQQTKQAFLRIINGKILPIELGFGDDPGAYYVIPQLAQLCNLSVEQTATYFYTTAIVLSCMVMAFGFFLLTKNWWTRLYSIFSIVLLGAVCLYIGDVYTVAILPVSLVPLFLYAFEKNKKQLQITLVFLGGLFVGLAGWMRLYSGAPFFIFFVLLLWIFRKRAEWKKLCLLYLLGYGICFGYFKLLFYQRNQYLSRQGFDLENVRYQHAFWHNVYPGMGFIDNNLGIYYADACSVLKVRSIDATALYPTPRYENILKRLVWDICVQQPHFVLKTLFAKLGVCFYFFFLFFNIGFFLIFFGRVSFWVHMLFIPMLGLSAAPAILTYSNATYLLGFIVCTVLYACACAVFVKNVSNPLLACRKLYESIVEPR